MAHEVEAAVRAGGAVPAAVAVVAGQARIGLDEEALEVIAAAEDVVKCGVRDLAPLAARGGHGATTVAATAHLAVRAGIRLFATGGLGGVHRGARETWDVSPTSTRSRGRASSWSARASSRSSTSAPPSSGSRR